MYLQTHKTTQSVTKQAFQRRPLEREEILIINGFSNNNIITTAYDESSRCKAVVVEIDDSLEHKVINDFFENPYWSGVSLKNDKNRILIIGEKSISLPIRHFIGRDMTGVFSEDDISQIKTYAKNNKEKINWQSNNFKIPSIRIINNEKMRRIFKNGGWDHYYELYPDALGTLSLSRVAFNRAKNKALLYIGFMSGGTAGYGAFVALRKEDDTWYVSKWYPDWES